jgi:hypothetical protein
MIREAIDRLLEVANLGARPTTLEQEGHSFVLNLEHNRYEEVFPADSPNRLHAFGTVAALTAYLKRWGEPAGASVLVTPKGIVAYPDERSLWRRDQLTVPFFRADLPPERSLTHEELLLYLDRHTGKIDREEEVRGVLSFVKAKDGVSLSTRDMGASVRIEMKAKKEIEARNAEDQVVTLPKYLTLTLRLGTREYEEPHRFRLQVTIGEGAVLFRLLHVDRDGALDRFLTRCVDDVRTALGEGWQVYEGA